MKEKNILNQHNRNLWFYFRKRFLRHKLAVIALIIIIIFFIFAIFADLLMPYNPNEQVLEFSKKPTMFSATVLKKKLDKGEKIIPVKYFKGEDAERIYYTDDFDNTKEELKSNLVSHNGSYLIHITYILGTDKFGRDILSRIIYGARVSLIVGIISQAIALIIGVLLGSIAGYYGKLPDKIIMWLINVVWAFPSILLVIGISLVLGRGLWQAFVAIGLTNWVDTARILRGQIKSIKEIEYIEAARATGFSNFRILLRHLLPNAFSPVIIITTVGLANAVIFEASLSFLGLGIQPPTASWGQMVYDGYKYLITGSNYGMVLYPAICIMIIVFAFNILGDGLRDALDPKMKK